MDKTAETQEVISIFTPFCIYAIIFPSCLRGDTVNKKLQVFVSSTYTDLIEERQAAVEAILDAGHIPAGMELFKAGNESQLKTIYKWIDESDVYMLILGGRYGSIESKSGKSYTQLEYEYALSKNIPVFAVVLSEAFLTSKINLLGLYGAMEKKAPDKYQSFKDLVMSKIIRKVDDCKDIKLAVHSTLNEFMSQYDLTGWVHNSNENDTLQILKDNNILLKENRLLNNQLKELKQQLESKSNTTFANFSFDEIVEIFKNKNFKLSLTSNDKITALDFYYSYFNKFATGIYNMGDNCDENMQYVFYNIAPFYIGFNFLERVKIQGSHVLRIQSTKLGSSFYAMLEAQNSLNCQLQ